MNWKPIETAPKDGSPIDLWVCRTSTFDGKKYQYRVTDARFDMPDDCYFSHDQVAQWIAYDLVCDGITEAPIDAEAIYWMPIPDAPK